MQITQLVIDTLKQTCEDYDIKFETIDENTRLFGSSGLLDSLGLVAFVSELEAVVEDKFKKGIILADEKAMSMRTSPFLSVKSLSRYIESKL